MRGQEPILVIDDAASIREMVSSVLTPRGHRLLAAADGVEALDLLRAATEPYIVVLDIVMPRLDGLGVIQDIERDPALRAAGHRIILMSSTIRLSASDIPMTAGQLVKPFTRQQLIAAVDAVRNYA